MLVKFKYYQTQVLTDFFIGFGALKINFSLNMRVMCKAKQKYLVSAALLLKHMKFLHTSFNGCLMMDQKHAEICA